MKLLLDQNLSRKLVGSLAEIWPGASHVHFHGLAAATDREIWDFSEKNAYTIVSKDNDFFHHVLLRGPPPRVIIVRLGNASTVMIRHCLLSHRALIEEFHKGAESVLLIS